MNIAQALKHKNKLIKEINDLWHKIKAYNSYNEKNPPPYDSKELLLEHTKKVGELVRLKTLIHRASAPVREDIFSLSELKSRISDIRALPTKEGEHARGFGAEVADIYKANITTAERDKLVKEYEDGIEELQEKLDQFNHATRLPEELHNHWKPNS
jgi:hypothetical protein